MPKFLRFVNAAAGKNPELLVYGEIGDWWGGDVQARDFAEQLQAITADEIDVRINSYGGSVFTAQAIYSSLKLHSAKINVFIDGIAASAATIIAMAGDVIRMPENAMMMIHNPLTGVFGNAEELREVADYLDKVGETVIAVYRDKSGLDDDKIIEIMSKDTYLTAAESLELGLIDEIIGSLKITASRGKNGSYELNGLTIEAERYKRLPEAFRNVVESQSETAETGKTQEKEVKSMTLDEFKAQHPELYQEVVNAGQAQERARIQAIEEMTMKGHEALATDAKYKTGVTPEAFAMELIKAEKAVKDKYLADRKDDADQSNVSIVIKQQDSHDHEDEAEKGKAVVNTLANALRSVSGRSFDQ